MMIHDRLKRMNVNKQTKLKLLQSKTEKLYKYEHNKTVHAPVHAVRF